MNYKSVLVAISLITFSIKSEAFNVEVAQWLPWKFIEQELKNTPLSFKLQPRDLTLQWQDWHPLLKGAALQVDGAWTQLQVQSTGINASAQGVAGVSVGVTAEPLHGVRLWVVGSTVRPVSDQRLRVLVPSPMRRGARHTD